MNVIEKDIREVDMGVLSIPNALLEAAGIPQDNDLTIEAVKGVLLIGTGNPLQKANQPFLDLFQAMGIVVEISKLAHVIAYTHEVDEDALNKLHLKCLEEVKRINGAIDFENAYRY